MDGFPLRISFLAASQVAWTHWPSLHPVKCWGSDQVLPACRWDGIRQTRSTHTRNQQTSVSQPQCQRFLFKEKSLGLRNIAWMCSELCNDLCFSPPARWGLLDFIRAVLLLLLRLLCLLRLLARRLLLAVQIPVGTAGPPPRAPDPSGHCRTSTASCRSQWALPDLNRDFQVAVGTAGPQPRAPDPSGHCRTSTASSRSQSALPDPNRDFQIAVGTAGPRLPDRSGYCRTSTATSRSQWALPDLNGKNVRKDVR